MYCVDLVNQHKKYKQNHYNMEISFLSIAKSGGCYSLNTLYIEETVNKTGYKSVYCTMTI